MIIPNAENIEAAVDELPKLTEFERSDQLKELHSAMGAATCAKIGVGFVPPLEFKTGYLLGVQTARVLLRGSVALMLARIKPEDVL